MNAPKGRAILDPEGIERAIVRIAHEILERNQGLKNLALVGIRTRGVYLAERLKKQIEKIENKQIPFGLLDITFYRDDLSNKKSVPTIKETKIDFDIQEKVVVLVDDVLYSGRTIRAALDALIDLGRPKAIQLAVLIDRGHRELPIKADYVGKNIPTAKDEEVLLHLQEKDGVDEVIVVPRTQ